MMFLLFIIGAYLVGSLSGAIILSRLLGFTDPRSAGSKNPGATNVLRTAGKSKAALVLLFDLLKGLIVVLITAQYYCLAWSAFAGFIAIIGHVFPLFHRFKGGKGVATALGVCLGLSGWLGLACGITWLIMFKLFRYSSLAALIAVCLAPLYAFFLLPDSLAWYPVLLITALIIYTHRDNIQRLRLGTESAFKKSEKNESR